MNLNSVVENVTKSVGLNDHQEGVSFSQFICDLVVESILKTLDQGTDGCINQKQVEEDVNENLTGFDDGTINLGEDDHKKKVILDHNVDKVIVAKKDGEGEDVEHCSKNVEDCSNKNKDSNETRSLKNKIVPSFSLGFSQDSEGDVDFDDKYGAVFKPLKKSFLRYIKEINHAKANEMADKNVTPVRLIMPWRTVYNKVDCGVFAMINRL
ncbi:unnamed protein product [Lactuca saligna]|uniref:Uncharacterized protein n=1 Tax=Lactuca saligna TaxID=75948 RepID=A0AA35VJ83_LACSI|nr:unnamed protein product [Lactuca saligna]